MCAFPSRTVWFVEVVRRARAAHLDHNYVIDDAHPASMDWLNDALTCGGCVGRVSGIVTVLMGDEA